MAGACIIAPFVLLAMNHLDWQVLYPLVSFLEIVFVFSLFGLTLPCTAAAIAGSRVTLSFEAGYDSSNSLLRG